MTPFEAQPPLSWPALSVAPMMERTDRHFRYFLRRLSRRTLLYTEMVTTGALMHGDVARHLDFHPDERPLALQLGGDDPGELAAAARLGERWGYDEINLNCGCPSPRVQKGNFGAALMLDPPRVAQAVSAMRAAVSIPVTVKHRLGVDEVDRYEDALAFVDTVAAAGCQGFAVHARKAWLNGLSPKENRTIPPLRHAEVGRLKAERPALTVALNGGVLDLEQAAAHLRQVDSVMIGRAAWDDPWLFARADSAIFGAPDPIATREEAIEAMIPYLEASNAAGVKTSALIRGLLQLFAGQTGARAWKRTLTEGGHLPAARLVRDGLAAVAEARRRHDALDQPQR